MHAGVHEDLHQFHSSYHLSEEQVDVSKHDIKPRVDRSKGVHSSFNINVYLLTTHI